MLPLPTDEELLLAFVDDCPSQATSDYCRRTGVDRNLLWNQTVYEFFVEEWIRRGEGQP